MAFTSIVASDLNGKGVVGLPDTPQLTTEVMQQKFDELALSVLVPAFNRLVSELGAQSAASNIGISLPEGSALDSNVAAVINWMLSDISESDQLRHSHANKAVLDLITLAVKTGYDRLVTLLASITEISATVKNSADSIPTGKAISEYISGLGGGDMLKSVYDTDNTGVVDNSEKLGGQFPSFYQKATDNTLTTANKTISGAINEINGKEVEVVDPMTATEPGTAADAKLTGDALKELNAKMGGFTLWTNPTPTESFAPQKILLSSNDYDKYKIRWRSASTASDYFITSEINKGDGTILSLITTGGAGVGAANRRIAYESDTILDARAASFAWGSTAAANNNVWCIPIEVIGFKS